MMKKRLLLLLSVVLTFGGIAATVERPFWRMNLNNVNIGAKYSYLGPNCTVHEEAGERYAKVKGGSFMSSFGTLGAWNFSDAEIKFEARFYDKIFPITLTIKNRGAREESKYENYSINIMKKQIFVSSANKPEGKIANTKAQTIKLDPELEPGKWYKFVVRYEGDKISISVDNDGTLKEVYKGDILPGGGSIGFDCKRNEVDFKNVEVKELSRNRLPYGERGVAEDSIEAEVPESVDE